MKHYIGIDNGVSGGIAILDENGKVEFYGKTPIQKALNYTKKKEYINRIVAEELIAILKPYSKTATVLIERPLVNPGRWKATISAIRCDEATRTILEALGMRYQYIDSKEWQSELLPKRKAPARAPKNATAEEKKKIKAKAAAYKKETKELSLAVGQRLFPGINFKKDADSILIAEYARRNKL